ncbi:hypothetical protein SAMN06297421_102297 [Aristaeella hokkaidonensis]|jgi:hypothetical protein|nr:hypothetical protein SAMN06297421_102297 [Aristaeella hokkaidonensis]
MVNFMNVKRFTATVKTVKHIRNGNTSDHTKNQPE